MSPSSLLSWILYLTAALAVLTAGLSPGLSLFLGLALAVTLRHPAAGASRRLSRVLLQGSVVLLGFGVDLPALLRGAGSGLVYGAATILGTFLLGMTLARLLRVRRETGLLLSAGTAICGGSAIAAVGSSIDARDEDMAAAMGVVFVLNALALWLFPPLGHALGFTEPQFGLWAGIAIHDVSSVVGAAAAYGEAALREATAVKLSRTLWIIPVALVARAWIRRVNRSDTDADDRPAATGGPSIPWFIAGFAGASALATIWPAVGEWSPELTAGAKRGLALTLFLIGTSLTPATLRSIGLRPLVLATILWVAITAATGLMAWSTPL